MQYDIDVNGELKRVSVTRDGDRFVVVLGEQPAERLQVHPGILPQGALWHSVGESASF